VDGKLHDQFVVDVIQGGAGTSTNMNANEVIANRALEILGYGKGEYDKLHPNEHVNMSQSTNDVYPTALRLATYWACCACSAPCLCCAKLCRQGRRIQKRTEDGPDPTAGRGTDDIGSGVSRPTP
jgi:fumarate hydratase class II